MQVVELAVEIDGAIAFPEQPDDVQRFLEAADGLGEVEPIRHGVLGLAAAETEDEAALGEVVDGQRALRKQHGMPSHRVDNAGRQRHVLRQHRCSGRDRHAVEMAMRGRRNGCQIGEFGRPDGVRPETHHVIGQPDRVVAAAVELLELG